MPSWSLPVAPTTWSTTLCGTTTVATEALASLPKPPDLDLVTSSTSPVHSAWDGRLGVTDLHEAYGVAAAQVGRVLPRA